MWHETNLGFKTRPVDPNKKDYDNNGKQHDENKQRYHTMTCNAVNNYNNHLAKLKGRPELTNCALILDALYCASSTTLHEECHFPLEWMHIVSRGIEFRNSARPPGGQSCEKKVRASKKIPHCFSGELYDYLLLIAAADEIKFDVLILDFCGSYHKHEECLRLLFEQRLIDDMAVGTVTFSARTNVRNDYNKQEKLEAANNMTLLAIANGYSIRFYQEIEYGTTFSLFFKVIHNMDAMRDDGGIEWTTDKKDASNWLNEGF